MSGFEALPGQGHCDTKRWKPTTLKEQAEFDAEEVFNGRLRLDRDNEERREYECRVYGADALRKHVKTYDVLSQEQRVWLLFQYKKYFLEHWRLIYAVLKEQTNER